MNEHNNEFYRDQTWQLLMQKIDGLEKGQQQMQTDINAIKNKMAWVFGMAAGITVVFNIGWQWILAKIQSKG